MRDIIAALLRDRGYSNDPSDTDDMYWNRRDLGTRPMLVHLAYELSLDAGKANGGTTSGWNTYSVSVASRYENERLSA